MKMLGGFRYLFSQKVFFFLKHPIPHPRLNILFQPLHNWVAISIIIAPCSWQDDSHCESRLDGREESG